MKNLMRIVDWNAYQMAMEINTSHQEPNMELAQDHHIVFEVSGWLATGPDMKRLRI